VSEQLLASLAIFVLAILVGFEVISKVPATLHTPLMSGANSIHGIVVVGAMLIAAAADDPLSYVLAFVAMVFGAANVVGGYVVTDRMLQMFRRRPVAARAGPDGGLGGGTEASSAGATSAGAPPAGATDGAAALPADSTGATSAPSAHGRG
jgi:NAD(P) transhydrogenase subunit alpha